MVDPAALARASAWAAAAEAWAFRQDLPVSSLAFPSECTAVAVEVDVAAEPPAPVRPAESPSEADWVPELLALEVEEEPELPDSHPAHSPLPSLLSAPLYARRAALHRPEEAP